VLEKFQQHKQVQIDEYHTCQFVLPATTFLNGPNRPELHLLIALPKWKAWASTRAPLATAN
jgi:hypothetical protein